MSCNTGGSNSNSISPGGGSRNDSSRITFFEERMSVLERQAQRLSLLVAEMCALQQGGATSGNSEEKPGGAREEAAIVSRGPERSEAFGPAAGQTLRPAVGHTHGPSVHDDDDDQSCKEGRSIGSRGGSDDPSPADVGPPRAGQYGGGGSAKGLGPDGESPPQWSGSGSFNLTILPHLPTFSGTSSFSRFEKEALLFARRCSFDSVFRPGASDVPVGDVSKSREDIIAEFSESELNANTDAWWFLQQALKSQEDRDMVRRFDCPSEGWRILRERHSGPRRHEAQTALQKKYNSRTMQPYDDPVAVFLEMEGWARDLAEMCGRDMDDKTVLLDFIGVLPLPEYEVEVTFLNEENLDRAGVLRITRERYKAFDSDAHPRSSKKGAGSSAFASGGGGDSRGGGGKGRGGKRGRSRRSRRGEGTGSQEGGRGRGNSSGGRSGGADAAEMLCYTCEKKGHVARSCPEIICFTCTGKGHRANVCPTPKTVLPIGSVRDDGADIDEKRKAVLTDDSPGGKLDAASEKSGELAGQLGEEAWIPLCGASQHLTNSRNGMINYRECNNRSTKTAAGDRLPIVGTGDLVMNFRSAGGVVRLRMLNVGHAPDLSHNLLSLSRVTEAGNRFAGNNEGITILLASGASLLAPPVGNHNFLYGHRVHAANKAGRS